MKKKVALSRIMINAEEFLKISNSDVIPHFFMSILSDSNHWMFISSNGGLTAGRKNSDFALFPYYTVDKITESAEITGSKTIFRVTKDGSTHIWEPLSERYDGTYKVSRHLYKNVYGNKIIFEEVNHDLLLTFRYQWNTSNLYGFVRKAELINNDSRPVQIDMLDGIQNILPYGVATTVQNDLSNLVDAYKRNELEESTGLGIYALSAIIVDRAEPSEALKANVVWSMGLDNPKHLLSSLQVEKYRKGKSIDPEYDIKAEKGAYLINDTYSLSAGEEKEWMIIANVNQSHSALVKISEMISCKNNLINIINQDIEKGTQNLIKLSAASDGLQLSADYLKDSRHFANTLFNIMRGGIFDDHFLIEKWDFQKYLSKANKEVFQSLSDSLEDMSDSFSLKELKKQAENTSDSDFKRLCYEYLPLKFSRRHGDPSRPWNKFSINTVNENDGSKVLDYQGNWRDIFQNWEALAHSYPEYVESMIHKFLNTSTFDGYNPYRITKDGFDWEVIEPDDPWAFIGYWGDHQIIYLLKFLEFIEDYNPGKLVSLFDQEIFVYANVPYKIKSYQEILQDSKSTITFDHSEDQKIRSRRDQLGADGALLQSQGGDIYKVNFIEKIMATVLAKLSNFIPEGGIWLNTQRPEWNDANNALVGNGVSMVTLYYLRRFLKFLESILENCEDREIGISEELLTFWSKVNTAFMENATLLHEGINDVDRKKIMDQLGEAGSEYRNKIYSHKFSGQKNILTLKNLNSFIKTTLPYLEHSIRANKRSDDLYHGYNLMTVDSDQEVSISHLYEMLEGQVAVLSAKYLSPQDALDVLDGMKKSALFRDDQYSYILYPNKKLPGFLQKNLIPESDVMSNELLSKLVMSGNSQLIEKDIRGGYHFNGNFRNADDLKATLSDLELTEYSDLVKTSGKDVFQIFEGVFNHKAFTGRSGTFFGYEGLGSIYWHMVSKLLLAVQEVCLQAIDQGEDSHTVDGLLEHFYEIQEGIGVHKSPSLYGAFSTDPYSHTPAGRGAQQPGMTGQVKEDIISRLGELGVFIREGRLAFHPSLLRSEEFLSENSTFQYFDLNEEAQAIDLEAGSLCFTFCQVPVVYKISDNSEMTITYKNGKQFSQNSTKLDRETSQLIFDRTGEVRQLIVSLDRKWLR